MLTLLMILSLLLVSCLAAAGLIASAHNAEIDGRTMADVTIRPDIRA